MKQVVRVSVTVPGDHPDNKAGYQLETEVIVTAEECAAFERIAAASNYQVRVARIATLHDAAGALAWVKKLAGGL